MFDSLAWKWSWKSNDSMKKIVHHLHQLFCFPLVPKTYYFKFNTSQELAKYDECTKNTRRETSASDSRRFSVALDRGNSRDAPRGILLLSAIAITNTCAAHVQSFQCTTKCIVVEPNTWGHSGINERSLSEVVNLYCCPTCLTSCKIWIGLYLALVPWIILNICF